mgnify:FL=1
MSLDTKIIKAAQEGDLTSIIAYCNKGHNIEDKDVEHAATLLYFAAEKGQTKIVSYLLERGANPDSISKLGETPLMKAAESNETEVIRLLLDNGANVNHQSLSGETALHIASRKLNSEALELLLDRGADRHLQDQNGRTAFYYALFAKSKKVKISVSVDERNAFSIINQLQSFGILGSIKTSSNNVSSQFDNQLDNNSFQIP